MNHFSVDVDIDCLSQLSESECSFESFFDVGMILNTKNMKSVFQM